MTRLTFLGTGGGRFATIYQTRWTAGIYLDDGLRVNIDPGPGTLVRMKALAIDPTQTDVLLVTHGHPDHYTDAEVMIEAMTKGGTVKKGTILASKSVIEGANGYPPPVSRFFGEKATMFRAMVPGDKVTVGHMAFEATPSMHSDLTAIGFKVYTKNGIISCVCDTQYFEGLSKAHAGCRLLILPVMRPLGSRIQYHLSVEDAATIINEVAPEATFLNHFGLKMVRADIERQVRWLREQTKSKVWAARDSTVLDIKTEINQGLRAERGGGGQGGGGRRRRRGRGRRGQGNHEHSQGRPDTPGTQQSQPAQGPGPSSQTQEKEPDPQPQKAT